MEAARYNRSGTEPTFEWIKANCTFENSKIREEERARRRSGGKLYIDWIKDYIKNKVTDPIYGFYYNTYWNRQVMSGEYEKRRKKLMRESFTTLDTMCSRMTTSTRVCFMYENMRSIPLDVFFAPYTLNTLAEDYEVIWDKGNLKLLKLENKFGIFWFCIFNHFHAHTLGDVDLIDEVYEDGVVRATARFKNPRNHRTQPGQNIVSISRIDPYICNRCHHFVPFMKKCGGCSRRLGVDVRYCSRQCQKEDYLDASSGHSHKSVCGLGADL